jgi:23S rRNA (uracil747-C5)-methyltransferase
MLELYNMKTFCAYFNQGICRSCTQLETPYTQQVQKKEDRLRDLLRPYYQGSFETTVYARESEFRNKAKFLVTGDLDHLCIGLAGDKDLDDGVDIRECPLHRPIINRLVQELDPFIRLSRLIPYQIKNKVGELKGLIVYSTEDEKHLYLRFVLRSKESLDRIKKHLPQLQEKFPELRCVSANIQPIPHAVLEGPEEVFLSSDKSIPYQLGKVKMRLHPQGFVQTNQAVAEKLYTIASEWVRELDVRRFAELFSGQGAFSFFAASSVEQAIGIEINADAVERANQTAKENQLHHLSFTAKDAGSVAEELKKFSADLVLVNPPRRGLGKASILLEQEHPPWIIYSSCNAETLAQDLETLRNYRVVKVQLFDMFPHTEHFETLVLLKSTSLVK